MHFTTGFIFLFIPSFYPINGVIFPGFGKKSQPNLSLESAAYKKGVYLEKKATRKRIFNLQNLIFKIMSLILTRRAAMQLVNLIFQNCNL